MTRTWVLTVLLSAALAGAVLAWSGVRQEHEFRRLIALGDASLTREQTSLAIEAFSGAVALKPDSMLGYLKRGDTYRRRGELPAALRDLRRAAALDPTAPRPMELLGDVNVAMGRFERAVEDYGHFIAIDDRSPRVLYKLALARYRNGQPDAALEPLRQAVAIEERFGEAHYLLGVCLRERRRDADALKSLSKAVSLNPAYTPARSELAELYLGMGRARDAIAQLEALAALEPTRAERLVSVGLAYARIGRGDTAISTLERAAERHPGAPSVSLALGRVWLDAAEKQIDRGALRKALVALQPAVAQEPPGGDTLAVYGRALFLSGDTAGAERVLMQAVSRPPLDADAYLYLSAAAQRLTRAEEARSALAHYATLAGPGAPDAAARVATLLDLQRQLRLTSAGSSPDRVRLEGRLPGN